MKKAFYFLLINFLLVFSASAQWSTDPLVNTIVNDMPGSQATPLIAYDNAGNFYVGFFSYEAGNYNVRLQYYNYDGIAQWAAGGILVSDNAQSSSLTIWDLITDNAGNCILAFQDYRNGVGNIYAYAISPAGTFLWGADGIALTSGSNPSYLPSLAVTSTNDVIAAWQNQGTSYKEVMMQKISPTGTVSWGSGITYQSGSQSYTAPRLLGVENGNFIMVFYKETGSFPAIVRSIYAQKFNASGTPVWASDVLVTNSNGISPWAYYPTIESDGANGVVVAWTDDRNSDNNINAAVQRVLSDGSILWPANGSEVSNINTDSDQNPRILGVNSSDEVLVSWSRKNGNQSQTAIAGQKFSANGTPMWTNAGIDFIPMSANVGGAIGGVVFDGTNALIVYDEYVTSTAYYHISALAVDNAGSLVWTPTNVLMAGRTTSKVHSVVSRLYNDQLIAVWEEGAATDDIYMQNIFTDGSLGTPPISDDATLSDLTVNGTTVEGFSPAVFTYDVAIPAGDPLPVTGATTNFPAATLSITQAAAVPGTATVLVTAEDGTTQLTYTVDFHVASTDAFLSDLTVDGTTIPGFDPAVFSYDYPVPTGNPIPLVGATASDPMAEVLINQALDLPGSATVVVTAEDGTTSNTYTVNYLYTPGSDATLADLQVGGVSLPDFDPAVLNYSYALVYNQPALYVLGIPNDPLATVDDSQCLSVPGDAVLVVTAEDDVTSLTYTVHFYYLGYDATLFDLTVDGTTIPGFDPNITEYQYQVAETTPIPSVDGTTSDPMAILTITQATVIPGTALLHVVAEDGVTELTYSVFFYTPSTDATLMDLTLDGTTIEGFDPAITYYEYDVYEGDAVPVIDAVTSDPLASMEITQAPNAPGDGYVSVTAQDGVTYINYTVHFNLITGIENETENTWQVFPNPVDNQLNLTGIDGETHIQIYTLLGERVYQSTISENGILDTHLLNQGIYFLNLVNQTGRSTTIKLIKK